MLRLIPLLFLALLLPVFAAAVMDEHISKTEDYNYNPFGEEKVEVETPQDFTVLILILVVLMLILYKGEKTLEHFTMGREEVMRMRRAKKGTKKRKKKKS